LQSASDERVLCVGLVRDLAMEAQAKDVQMDMQTRERVCDQLIAAAERDAFVKLCVLVGKMIVLGTRTIRLGWIHLQRQPAQLDERFIADFLGCTARCVRLDEQPYLVQFFELLAIERGCRAVTDEALLRDEPMRFEHAQRFADRRLGNTELFHEPADRNAGIRRDLQRHDVGPDDLEDFIDEALRALDARAGVRELFYTIRHVVLQSVPFPGMSVAAKERPLNHWAAQRSDRTRKNVAPGSDYIQYMII